MRQSYIILLLVVGLLATTTYANISSFESELSEDLSNINEIVADEYAVSLHEFSSKANAMRQLIEYRRREKAKRQKVFEEKERIRRITRTPAQQAKYERDLAKSNALKQAAHDKNLAYWRKHKAEKDERSRKHDAKQDAARAKRMADQQKKIKEIKR